MDFTGLSSHPERVKGIAYLEALVRPLTWQEWPEKTREFFQDQRSPAGEEMILQKNLFVEYLLPLRVIGGLSQEMMAVYRRPYRDPASRQPMLTWSRELPIEGEPADVVQIVDSYARWLATSSIPKLSINGDPGGFLIGAQREFCRTWPNQQEITVKGTHFLQEDSSVEIGQAIAHFVGQLSRMTPARNAAQRADEPRRSYRPV